MTQMPFFQPTETRKPFHQLIRESSMVSKLDNIKNFLGAMSQIILVLNKERQMVFANEVLLKFLNIETVKESLGKRPGDLFLCVNANKAAGGCGSSQSCSYCGALHAIMQSQLQDKKVTGECRIRSKNKEGQLDFFDLEVVASPIYIEGQVFTILSLADISSAKRRDKLERTFFHDIMNIAGSLSSIMELVPDMGEDQKEDFLDMATILSKQVVDELKSHQSIIQAENRDLEVKDEVLSSKEILVKAVKQLYHHQVAKGKFMSVALDRFQCEFRSDGTLINRVLVNLLKNALEASEEKGVVKIGCTLHTEDTLRFWVRNTTFMPKEVQAQVFQRSFSTKGQGRGIGTYSVKILAEQYLDSKVSFISEPEEGTVFFIDVPWRKDEK